jgi:hypothetical protein
MTLLPSAYGLASTIIDAKHDYSRCAHSVGQFRVTAAGSARYVISEPVFRRFQATVRRWLLTTVETRAVAIGLHLDRRQQRLAVGARSRQEPPRSPPVTASRSDRCRSGATDCRWAKARIPSPHRIHPVARDPSRDTGPVPSSRRSDVCANRPIPDKSTTSANAAALGWQCLGS